MRIPLAQVLGIEFGKKLLIFGLINVLVAMAEMISIGSLLPFLSLVVGSDGNALSPALMDALTVVANEFSFLSELQVASAIFIGAALVALLLRVWVVYLSAGLMKTMSVVLSKHCFNKVLALSAEDFSMANSAELHSILSQKVNASVMQVIMPLVNLASSLFVIVGVVAALMVIGGSVAGFIFGCLSFFYTIVFIFRSKKLGQNSKEINRLAPYTLKILGEGLDFFRELKIFGANKLFIERYCSALAKIKQAQASNIITGSLPKPILEFIGIALIVSAVNIGTLSLAQPDLLVILGVVIISIQRLLPGMQTVFSAGAVARGNFDSLLDVEKLLLDFDRKESDVKHRAPLLFFKTEIELKNVVVKRGSSEVAVGPFELNIKKGEKIGIAGPSGSGKSTIIDILIGFAKPVSGEVMVDGKKYRDDCRFDQINSLSIVAQESPFLDGSIMANITLNETDDADHDKISEVLELSECFGFRAGGLVSAETLIGESGGWLSGGQRQRIAIARALYLYPDVLVLDEATSALDTATEFRVMRNIMSVMKNKTLIVVSHRPELLKLCDRIIELKPETNAVNVN